VLTAVATAGRDALDQALDQGAALARRDTETTE
jgi:hypothetical protein